MMAEIWLGDQQSFLLVLCASHGGLQELPDDDEFENAIDQQSSQSMPCQTSMLPTCYSLSSWASDCSSQGLSLGSLGSGSLDESLPSKIANRFSWPITMILRRFISFISSVTISWQEMVSENIESSHKIITRTRKIAGGKALYQIICNFYSPCA